jgi:hypothetical protein
VRIDLDQLHSYSREVYASTDAYLATVPDDAFDPVHGETPAGLLSGLLLTLSMRRGEIACLLALDRFGYRGDCLDRRQPGWRSTR